RGLAAAGGGSGSGRPDANADARRRPRVLPGTPGEALTHRVAMWSDAVMTLRQIPPESTAAPTTLVLANLLRNRTRLAIALVGVAFSVFLMVFQASLLVGFIEAAQRVVRSIDGAVWLVPHGVPCFDFAAKLPRRYADLARQTAGTTGVVSVVSGFTTLVRPDGIRRPILLVGSERAAGTGYPFPESADAGPHPPDGLSIDRSSAEMLGSLSLPVRLEVAGFRGRVVRHVDGFASFLGSPYAFASYGDAHRMLDFGVEDASFLVVRTRGDADP